MHTTSTSSRDVRRRSSARSAGSRSRKLVRGWVLACASLLFTSPDALALPEIRSEQRVFFDGAPACAYNPEYSLDGRFVSYLEPLPIPLYEILIRPIDPETGTFGPELTCDERIRVSPFGRPVLMAEDTSGTPYFLYMDASKDTIHRARITDDGAGGHACEVDELGGGTPYGPPPPGEVWRSIAAYTEPGAGGRSYLTYIASDENSLGRSRWVEIRVAEHDDAGALLSEFTVERQEWDPACYADPICKQSFGGVLPLDKAYVRWIQGARPAALLYGSVPTPLAWGTRPAEYPPELERADMGSPARFVTDDGIYPVSIYGYDAGRAAVAGYDDGVDAVAYGLDPATDEYEILAVIETDLSDSQNPTPEDGRAVDIEPFVNTFMDGGVFQLAESAGQYVTGVAEIWLLSRQERRSMRISDASTHAEPQKKQEPEVVPTADAHRTWVYYSAFDADEENPWAWSPNPVCHELWRIELEETGDADADGVSDELDECPRTADGDQADADLDGEGDACDCLPDDPSARRPASVTGVRASSIVDGVSLDWEIVPGAESYRVSRGRLSELEAWRYGQCEPESYDAPPYTDSERPEPGDGAFYLVVAEDAACGLGSLGSGGPAFERLNVEIGGCE